MRTLNDGQVYRRLTAIHDDLLKIADGCISVRGETAVRAAAAIIRRLASAFFRAAN